MLLECILILKEKYIVEIKLNFYKIVFFLFVILIIKRVERKRYFIVYLKRVEFGKEVDI